MNIILNSKYEIKDLNKGITLQESIDGISYTATIELLETDDLKSINIKKGDKIILQDINAETNKLGNIFNGVVWEVTRGRKDKKLTITGKERTVYMENSEDEYLFPEGQTAKQRILKYAKDWGIAFATLPETKIKLSKAKYDAETILSMIQKDLKETVQKGGNMYKVRMADRLEIVQIGSNKNIWQLDTVLEDTETTSSLEGAITKIKVLGESDDENKLSPVIGTYSKYTAEYGTLQKILQDDKVTNVSQAKTKANTIFNSGKETCEVTCTYDINTIRSGDAVMLGNTKWYVIDVTHDLNIPYKMELSLGTLDYIRTSFYTDE